MTDKHKQALLNKAIPLQDSIDARLEKELRRCWYGHNANKLREAQKTMDVLVAQLQELIITE